MDVSLLIRLVDQFTGPAQKVRGALENIGSGINSFKSGASDALKSGFSIDNIEAATKNAEIKLSQARGKLLGAFGQALAIGAPVIKAAQFDQSMKGLEKVLNDLPVERIQQLRKFALDTSALIPIAAKDLLELMSEAAQGDVPQEELEAFSTYVAKASVAFDMAGKEIGERFAKLRNVYKLNQEGIEDLGDATNHLSNNMAAKAEQITNFTNRANAAAGTLKLSAVQMAAIGTAMVAAGSVPETAARGMVAFSTRVLAGGKKIDAAFEEIGVSREKLLKDIQNEGPTALLKFFELLASKGDEGKAALKDIVGQDYYKDFAKLIDNPQLLAKALQLVANQSDYAGSATEEAAKQAEGAVKKWELLVNKLNRGAIVIGDQLLPTLLELATQVGAIIDRFAEWATVNPELTKYLVTAIAALMGLSIAGKVLGVVFAGMRAGILPLLGFFLKFNSAGRNVAKGWLLIRLGAVAARRAFGLLASTSRVVAAGLRGIASGAAQASRQIIATQGRARTMATAVRRMIAASWIWTLGFEILDDLGRTPEERMEQVRKNHERWKKIEKDVEKSWFGQMWQGMKDRANAMMGLEQGVVPAEALSAWGKAKAKQFYDVGVSWMGSLRDGLQSLWKEIETWFNEQIAWLKGLLNFDLKINWPTPPEWLTYLMGIVGKGVNVVKDAVNSSAGALVPPGINSGEAPLANVSNPLGDAKVDQTITVVNGQTPNLNVGPIHITGVSDPQAAVKAAGAEFGRRGAQLMSGKSGALHGGTE
ncbi:phage tail tape measure protein [Brucella sp. 2280]|uniref:phage tail tape measure protein n=1 Tax=Brucella sp. 2280 TaxID=2592625 RepID=UPI001295397A|nr:phage tail tape measure protein [Brucella sp. 2280]QGA56362.1 phage tail tape measure protein [Brucella sp. 2280]